MSWAEYWSWMEKQMIVGGIALVCMSPFMAWILWRAFKGERRR